ncbi:MAG: heparinase II/III family protein [Actinomycetota bacterium]|nr:heparinase II/III family protein [Actinomycetota bacterium]
MTSRAPARSVCRLSPGRSCLAPARPALQPVVCLVEHLYRDLLLARDATVGRFTHLGHTLELGRRPDWLTNPVADVEWRIEWVKSFEGLHLAAAYAATGNSDFLACWEDLVESFCDQVPVGYDTSDVSARRLQNWLYAWQAFAAAPRFPGLRCGLAQRLVTRIGLDARHLASHLTPERNHRTLELYTLLLVALALGEQGQARRELNELADNARTDIWPDGVHREASTDYHAIALRSFLGAIANARWARLRVPPVLLERVNSACDVAMHMQRPDGITPALSDGDEADFGSLFACAADLLDRADLLWVASGGMHGRPPAQRLVSYPIGGYHLQRSGWGDRSRRYCDEHWCVFDCGPLGDGGHGHYDQLSVVMAAQGKPLVVDPGRFTYEPESPWRHWFKGTAAHNTVCVDGLDQTPFRPGKPKGPVSRAQLLGRLTQDGFDLLRGRVDSPSYDAVHTRTLAFVDDDYWIAHDRLRAPTAHTYEARWHLPPSAHGRVHVQVGSLQTTVHTPECTLVVPSAFGRVDLQPGWVSPTYGTKLPAPVVVVRAAGRCDMDLLTVLIPGDRRADVLASVSETRLEVQVRGAGAGVDELWWDTEALRGERGRSRC